MKQIIITLWHAVKLPVLKMLLSICTKIADKAEASIQRLIDAEEAKEKAEKQTEEPAEEQKQA